MTTATARPKVAIIDDWLGVAEKCADWAPLRERADVTIHYAPFASEQAAAAALEPYDIILAMRERTSFTANLLAALPRLRMLALTGYTTQFIDLPTCKARGIVLSGSGIYTPVATAELTLALILASARDLPRADAAIRAGRFQSGLALGETLEGKALGVIGLGRIGARVARYGQALGMHVLAWSANLDAGRAESEGATYADKDELLRKSDVVTLHLMLSDRSRHCIAARELALMQPGALLVNTARSALVDTEALTTALRAGKIRAALDVFDQEPVPAGSDILDLPNTVLTPHLGFSTRTGMEIFYRQSLENILGFLDGVPKRVIGPSA